VIVDAWRARRFELVTSREQIAEKRVEHWSPFFVEKATRA